MPFLKKDSPQVEWIIGVSHGRKFLREVTPSSQITTKGRGHPEENRIIIGG
jgi:hypothetical protein